MLFIDLDHLINAFNKNLFWSYNRLNIGSLNKLDYYVNNKKEIKESIVELIKKKIGTKVDGKIFLLTNGKYFGYCFNPVSFYYCFDKSKKLIAIVSHITNTPWDEKYAYVHDCKNKKSGTKNFKFNKKFHVSPFMPMAIKYNWKFTEPKDFLYVSMDSFQEDKFNFNATLKLTKRAWTPWALNKILLTFPPTTIKIILVIYWNAFLLFIKRIPFYPHPKK
jgi:DUF1365 family protein|tara:strand:+ start:2268 stop:2927 length:660 start_codon:yes stop_codon:yes gene_type:complete